MPWPAVLVGIVLLPGAAHASCAAMSVAQQARLADAVFVGSATQDGSSATVRVTKVYQGVVGRVVRVDGGESNAEGRVRFSAGSEYLFFVHKSGQQWSTGVCAGTRPVGERVLDTVRRAIGPPSAPADLGPGTGQGGGVPGLGAGAAVLLAVLAALVVPRARRRARGRPDSPGSVGSAS